MSLQLMEETGPEQEELFLRNALSGAQRMRATIAGLMDFAVLGGRLSCVRLDMDSVVSDVLADLEARLGRSQVLVGELPKVWGDDVQVRAVTQNPYVANALKYAGHVPEPIVRVTGVTDGGFTRISVSDNGPGVPENQRDTIFGLLVRGQDAPASGVEGHGIGLATCASIVAAHGGAIGVEDRPGGGAEFWFELPSGSPREQVPSRGVTARAGRASAAGRSWRSCSVSGSTSMRLTTLALRPAFSSAHTRWGRSIRFIVAQ